MDTITFCRTLPASLLLVLQLAAALDGVAVTDENEHAVDTLVESGFIDIIADDFAFPTEAGFDLLGQ